MKPSLPNRFRPPTDGISGVTGNIKSIAHLAKLLESYFLPASLVAPPGAKKTGGRVTLLKTSAPYVSMVNGQSGAITLNTPPILVATLTLAAGTVTWTFSTPFDNPPIVLAMPINAGGSAASSMYANGAPTATGVVINSQYTSDARTIMAIAIGNPD